MKNNSDNKSGNNSDNKSGNNSDNKSDDKSDNKSDNKSDDNTELKRINITKIRNEANEIGNLIDKPNYNVDELRNKFNSFYNAYPILFNNLVNKKMSLEELNILLNTLDNVQDHFFKSI